MKAIEIIISYLIVPLSYIYIYIDCAARPRSRQRAMSMNVAKQKSKYIIWKCITTPWRAANGRRKKAKGNQKEANWDPRGARAKWKPNGNQKGNPNEARGAKRMLNLFQSY